MKDKTKAARGPSEEKDKRGLSQVLFVIIGVGIIVGGLWSLYMADAPYHPEDAVTRNGVSLAGD